MTMLLFAEFGFHFLLFRFENLCRILIIQQYIRHRVFGHFQCFCKVRGIIYLWNRLSDFCKQIKDLLSAKELIPLFKYVRLKSFQIRLMEAVSQGWALAEQYLEKGIREGKIRKNISKPVVMAMIRGTVTCFLESDILYKNGLTYEQGKEEMVQIIMKGIREA